MNEIEKYYNGEIHVDFEDTLLEITPELMKKTIIIQDKEIERLKSIIKEVREYIEDLDNKPADYIVTKDIDVLGDILDILDKENKDGER